MAAAKQTAMIEALADEATSELFTGNAGAVVEGANLGKRRAGSYAEGGERRKAARLGSCASNRLDAPPPCSEPKWMLQTHARSLAARHALLLVDPGAFYWWIPRLFVDAGLPR